MSNIALTPNASGSGTLSIASPNTASNITFNLPATLGNAGASNFVTTDASGNLGLGVTPSAWYSSYKAFDINSASSVAAYSSGMSLFQNCYWNGSNFIYKTSAAATSMSTDNGTFYWNTAPSGTAGDPITFTQAMTLDASGNLGIGTSSPASKLSIYGSSGNSAVSFFGSGGSAVGYIGSTSSGNYIIGAAANETFIRSDGVGIAFSANTGSSVQMRIDSSGNVGIGTSSPNKTGYDANARVLTVYGSARGVVEIGSDTPNNNNTLGSLNFLSSTTVKGAVVCSLDGSSNGQLLFVNNDTERARITAGGYFKASDNGTYVGSTSAYHEMYQSTGNQTICYFGNNSTTPSGIQVTYLNAAPNGTGNELLYCADTSAQRAAIRSNGGLANYSANDVNLSDRREKTNFAPAKSYLDTICAIPVQTFNYIDQSEDDPGLTLGVVAQDVQAVAPELVMESNWGTKEEPKMRLSIYQTDLQYALMKCIQEQQAIIESLTARIAALEGAA